MSISEIHTKTFSEALLALENLALEDDVGFRGHSNVDWRLCSTLSRFTTIAHQNWDVLPDMLLSHFMVGLASVGKLPSLMNDRRSRLEFGRHYAVPSPLIDFTLSPYVALFFAFNGVRADPSKKDGEVVVYGIRFQGLAHGWARICSAANLDLYDKYYREFLYERNPLFVNSYPAYSLKLIRFPASWNTRMLRQMGMFVYDTLDYSMLEKCDLEDLIGDIKEPGVAVGGKVLPSPATLSKVFIPKSIVREVFERLELMGMTGVRLLDDHEGAAADVYNSYNYNRKTGYAWNLEMEPPDDTKP
jgi:hypothetical protein